MSELDALKLKHAELAVFKTEGTEVEAEVVVVVVEVEAPTERK